MSALREALAFDVSGQGTIPWSQIRPYVARLMWMWYEEHRDDTVRIRWWWFRPTIPIRELRFLFVMLFGEPGNP